MSENARQAELESTSQHLLEGPLQHVRAAALAAALLPLASVAVTPAEAQVCSSGGTVCGFVFNDLNNNGEQDAGEPGIEGAVVTLDDSMMTATDATGYYEFWVEPGTYEIAVQIPPGSWPSPANGGDDTLDSDGVSDGMGNSVASVTLLDGQAFNSDTDFGFSASAPQPGTGTPGYWKNHPEAWPVASLTIGGVVYSQAEALYWLENVNKDKTTTMFSSLVSAKLNVLVGNDPSCVQSTIDAADDWMATNGPVGSGVHAASLAWKIGEPLHRLMDNYNNGMLCAPHRE
jgi:hypothetical protein